MQADALLSLASTRIVVDEAITLRTEELVCLGYGPFDALHLAAAESGGVDVLVTADDRLLRRASRGLGSPRIRVCNPLSWIKEQEP